MVGASAIHSGDGQRREPDGQVKQPILSGNRFKIGLKQIESGIAALFVDKPPNSNIATHVSTITPPCVAPMDFYAYRLVCSSRMSGAYGEVLKGVLHFCR